MTALHLRLRPRAIHESGHAIAALAFGVEFGQAYVSAWKGRVEGGELQQLWDRAPKAWQIFGAAGLAAERIWLAQNGLQEQEREAYEDSEMDNGNIAHLAQHGGMSVSEARKAAHLLIVANWAQTVRLGLVLEQRKRMQFAAARRAAGRIPHQGKHRVQGERKSA